MDYNEVKVCPLAILEPVQVRLSTKSGGLFWKHHKAVVSRGGRPDMALSALHQVTAHFIIVGGMDVPVIGMNKMAFDELQSVKEMKIIHGATHLFENPESYRKSRT
jgi:hypothetical protein